MKKDSHIMNKYDFYLKLIEVTLKNVEQYSKDAILLRDNLSFGHAYSLAILGFEELAKCWFAFGLFIGEFQEDDEIVPKITSDHLVKQNLGWQILAGFILFEWYESTIYKSEIKHLAEQFQSGNISLEAHNRKFYSFAELESKKSSIALSVLELTKVLEKLDKDNLFMTKRKNEGFYVDFNLIKKEITNTPDKFILADVDFIETFNGFFNFTKDFIQHIKENLERKTMKEAIENIRRAFDFIRKELM